MEEVCNLTNKKQTRRPLPKEYFESNFMSPVFDSDKIYKKDLENLVSLKSQNCPLKHIGEIVCMTTFEEAINKNILPTHVQRSLQLMYDAGYSLKEAKEVTNYNFLTKKSYAISVAKAKQIFAAAGYVQ